MDRATIARLDRINRDFYVAHAGAFAATREAPWPGWERLLPHLRRLRPAAGGAGGALRILDAGCGSGRLARWLHARLERPPRCVGLDRSLPILLLAADGTAAAPPPAAWILADLVSSEGRVPCRTAAFDATAAIGLLHHVPSFALRRALIEDLLRLLRPGGLLALAFWQFGADPRFERRAVAWELATDVDPDELEPGDRLLAWGESAAAERAAGGVLRYCHYTDPGEADRLTDGLPAEIVEAYLADGRTGRLNLYRILRRT